MSPQSPSPQPGGDDRKAKIIRWVFWIAIIAVMLWIFVDVALFGTG